MQCTVIIFYVQKELFSAVDNFVAFSWLDIMRETIWWTQVQ